MGKKLRNEKKQQNIITIDGILFLYVWLGGWKGKKSCTHSDVIVLFIIYKDIYKKIFEHSILEVILNIIFAIF